MNCRLLKWTLSLSAVALGVLLPALAAAQDASYTAAGAKPGSSMMWAFYIIGGLTVMGAVATITRRQCPADRFRLPGEASPPPGRCP